MSTRKTSKAPLAAAADSERISVFGPPPLLPGEDPAAYHALDERVRAPVDPRDMLEEIWVRDIVDRLWEILRLRRLKAKAMQALAHEGLAKLLRALTGTWSNEELVSGWIKRDRAAVLRVKALLKEAGFDEETIAAQTLLDNLAAFEKIDRSIMQAEARRDAAFREIERRRDLVAARLRNAVRAIEDAEFKEVSGPENGAAP